MENKTQKNRRKKVLKWYVQYCKQYEIPNDLFDIEMEMDSSLSIQENKDAIKTKLTGHIKPELLMTRAEAKAIEDQAEAERQAEADQLIDEWKQEKANYMVASEKITTLSKFIEMTIKGFNHSLIVTGRAGLGKTYTTINILKELKTDFKYKSGYTTPLGLYKFLYQHKNSHLILDDLEGMMNNESAVAILKTALWEANGKRLVSYETTSKLMEGTPSVFEFTGTIIILANELRGGSGENFKALLSRAINYELSFKHEEILKICYEILDHKTNLTNEQKAKVKSILKSEIAVVSEFNLRLFERLLNMVKYDFAKAKDLFNASVDVDEELALVYKLNKKELSVKEQYNNFASHTGRSRRTFFRLRNKVKELEK